MNTQKLKFPIGEYKKLLVIKSSNIKEWIEDIKLFPAKIAELTQNLSEEQLNWRYRPEGWNVRQVVHHCADSHLNSLVRLKLSLTEDTPTIKPYAEDKWAELPDTTELPIADSLKIIEGLHARWVYLLERLSEAELQREFFHPEAGRKFTVAENIGVYAWHCNHHLAHIRQALEHKGKFN